MTLVVHFSATPLAGAPIRLVNAINQHTNYSAHLVDLDFWGIFDTDLIYKRDKEYVIELVKYADIIHLHNYLNLDTPLFDPINFRELQRIGKKLIRHYHSSPKTIADFNKCSINSVINEELPTLVIAQYHERFYPQARVVPNILPQSELYYSPPYFDEPIDIDLLYSPTSNQSAWQRRWETKGFPETDYLLQQVARKNHSKYQKIINRPLTEVLAKKKKSRIIIDEMITGSYHLSGLEGLCLGKPVLSYLDNRVDFVMREISGALNTPFVNVRLEEAGLVLTHLLQDKGLCSEIGKEGRTWIETYWQDAKLVQSFVEVYDLLLEHPKLVTRQSALDLTKSSTSYFFSMKLPDLVYESRKPSSIFSKLYNNYLNSIHLIKKIVRFSRSHIPIKRNHLE